MSTPALFLGVLLSTLYGALFHLWRGGNASRFLLYLVLGWLGFWIGHFIGEQFGWDFGNLGPLNLGVGTAMSFFFMGVGYWLSLVEVNRK